MSSITRVRGLRARVKEWKKKYPLFDRAQRRTMVAQHRSFSLIKNYGLRSNHFRVLEKVSPETAVEVARYLTSIGGPSRSRIDSNKHWQALHRLDEHKPDIHLVWPYFVHAATRSMNQDERAYAIRRLSMHVSPTHALAWQTYPIFLRAALNEHYSLARTDAIGAIGKFGGKLAERDLIRVLRRVKARDIELAAVKELGKVGSLSVASIILKRMRKAAMEETRPWYEQGQYYGAISQITARANSNMSEAMLRYPLSGTSVELAAIRICVASHPERYGGKKPLVIADDLFKLEQEMKTRKLGGFLKRYRITLRD